MNLLKLYKLNKELKKENSIILSEEELKKVVPAFCDLIDDSVIKEKEEPFNRDKYYKELREFFTAYGKEHAEDFRRDILDD